MKVTFWSLYGSSIPRLILGLGLYMTLSFGICQIPIFPVMNTMIWCERVSVTTHVVGFFPESESSFGIGRAGESAEGGGVVKSSGPPVCRT